MSMSQREIEWLMIGENIVIDYGPADLNELIIEAFQETFGVQYWGLNPSEMLDNFIYKFKCEFDETRLNTEHYKTMGQNFNKYKKLIEEYIEEHPEICI